MPVTNPFLQPVRSAADYQNDFATADARRNQNAMQSATLQDAADARARAAAFRSTFAQGGDLADQGFQNRLYAADPTLAGQAITTYQTGVEKGAKAKADIASAGNLDADAAGKREALTTRTAQQAIADTASFRTPQDALTSLNAHFQRGDIDPLKYEMVRKTLEPALQDPAQFPGWKHQTIINIQDAVERAKLQAPKVDMVNAGGAMVPTQANPDAGPVGPVAGATPIPITQSADNAASNATSRANNAATQAGEDRRSGATLAETARHNQATEGGKAPLNEGQAKALGFGSRMAAADKVLASLATEGVDKPVAGGLLGAVGNAALASPKQQQVEQAQRDFLNAVLRRESGAAISPSEFDSGRKQYFPQIGDSKEVIAQKARNRKLATDGVLVEVPPAQRGSLVPQDAHPEDIQALIDKYGKK